MKAILSPRIVEHIEAMFAPDQRDCIAALLLQQCGNNLPGLDKLNEVDLERFRFAALKLGGGDAEKRERAVRFTADINVHPCVLTFHSLIRAPAATR